MKNIKKMPNHGTTIVDIYEAAGGTASADRSSVITVPGSMKPFKIELLVIPQTIESNYDAPDMVTLGVILHDEVMFDETPNGSIVLHHDFDVTVRLPISQVKIVEKANSGG